MPWWKGEDSWDDCEAFNCLSAESVALFLRAQARMSRQLSDGVLTVDDLERLDLSRPRTERRRRRWSVLMTELVERGLFTADGDHWRDAGWLVRNPSAAEISLQRRWDVLRQQVRFAGDDAKRAELRSEEERVKKALWAARSRRKASIATSDLTGELTSEVTGEFTAPRPDPSSPAPPIGEGEDGYVRPSSPLTNGVHPLTEQERTTMKAIIVDPNAHPKAKDAARKALIQYEPEAVL